jgi:hypothetical protein
MTREQYEMVCREKFEEIISRLDDIASHLYKGNGGPSIIVRMDRLEQTRQTAARSFWIAVTAIVTAVVLGIKEMFFTR